MRHGPHHSAQKSTRTGPSACRTSWSHVADVVTLAVIVVSFSGKSSSVVRTRGAFGLFRTAARTGQAASAPARFSIWSPRTIRRTGLAERGEEVLDVERRDGAAAGGGDRLAVGRVDDVARGEDARRSRCATSGRRPRWCPRASGRACRARGGCAGRCRSRRRRRPARDRDECRRPSTRARRR